MPTNAPSILERTVENLVTVLGAPLPSLRARQVHASPVDGLIALAGFMVVATFGAIALDATGQVTVASTLRIAGALSLGVALAVAFVLVFRRPAAVAGLAVGLVWAMTLGVLLAVLVHLAADVRSPADRIVFGVLPGLVPALIFLVSRLGPLAGVLALIACFLPTAGAEFEGLRTGGAGGLGAALPDTEAVYALQDDLLAAETRVRPGDPAVPELFAVLGAGFAGESVFAREVAAVADLLARDFGAAGRVVRLVNDDDRPTGRPLLNRGNLRHALERVGAAMDPDDILFLYLTSHGAPQALSTEFYPVVTRDIAPGDIDGALRDAGIEHAVIVISACYSGSFVETLMAPTRLVLTAARADRASFGCSDKSEWTEWGRAFFVEALPAMRDPRAAALEARDIVAALETGRGLEPSEPQIAVGREIGPVLDRWLETLD